MTPSNASTASGASDKTFAPAASWKAESDPLLEISDLEVAFRSSTGLVPAVRKANLTLYPGQSVAIVGESGSGKSTLAAALERHLEGWQVLHLDDWYPGWDGLAAGADIARRIAADLREGRASSYVTWDWETQGPGHTVDVPLAPTIIEGCGAWDADADLSVWVADPGEAERRNRALARDGATYAPHWQRWADQDLGRSLP